MDSISLATLSRQSGLMTEMRVIANNVANLATTGYRQEGLMFTEFLRDTPGDDAVALATARVRRTSLQQGALRQTGASFDLAIEGEGYFLIETPNGERLSRSGTFTPNAQGDLVTPDGWRVLDAGGAPLFVPPDAGHVSIAPDGTMSAGDRLIGQIGLVQPAEESQLIREDGVMFRADGGFDPVENPRVLQGFLEGSNVDAVNQMARMIEVQRAYELGQSFLESEDQRVRNALDSFIK